ncbi:kinesin-like protein KIN-UB isoform X2 [Selaginella moellendorffii]|uniref:kinesin-like protein KIN-UB isoform X2 n=1 Tax=Selaginella moellendorffii TaxID=88036 RepID=UPI000D1CB6F8|nr:kinesin-like protein KIN-UB isoform X2 [Selaginella moellendorffii]|eukprot:XP_024520850.1 kinesin-like protein KIN-UB isoform X2 [Selaginella moellendorffii]
MAYAGYKNLLSVGSRAVRLDRPFSVGTMAKPSVPSPPPPLGGPLLRPKSASPSSARRSSIGSQKNDSHISGRVRVAVRIRPRNAEELIVDADFGDCVELQPELKRLRLRKNNWDCETYQFDEVFAETASQKRVYEVVAKPVVESVLEGYNGTVMAYGQTGTGKTFTLGRLGEEDSADRGIMVRAMEDILSDISPENDSVTVSYLQLYMETVQDLLAPERDNIPIVEDPKTGDVTLPGATLVPIIDHRSFVRLLQVGEANRFAANTKLNTESSRSHAILLVNVRKVAKGNRVPTIRKSKLVIVDLAGSERVYKSGSEGHTLEEAKSINLSLTALGKCINALAENSPHVPTRDSKLTRILRDSFGGTARTSLIITIGPSPQHRGETASTIMFGQRAMKVENMVKLKEEFDYKGLCRRLESELDKLIVENERQAKAIFDSEEELEKRLEEARHCVAEAENKLASSLDRHMQIEKAKHQKELMELSQKHTQEVAVLMQTLALERAQKDNLEKDSSSNDSTSQPDEALQLKQLLKKESRLREQAEQELKILKSGNSAVASENEVILSLQTRVDEETRARHALEKEIQALKQQLQVNDEVDEPRKSPERDSGSGADSPSALLRPQSARSENGGGQRATIARLFEQVGLQKILSLLESEDIDVRVHAVKVVANLAAEEANQEKIVEAGGLHSLLSLLRGSEDETIRRVAAGAIANLAMNEINQELIMTQGGIGLLAKTSDEADDPQTLRMVAGAIANLCGNDKLQMRLREEGGIRALLGMVRSRHPDVLAQVARGIANFAKCESRAAAQVSGAFAGYRNGRSLLIDDGALPWIVANANNEASPIRRHIELALCHLAQHEVNAKDLVAGGALWELIRISKECSREDIRNLAFRTLNASPTYQAELRRLHLAY